MGEATINATRYLIYFVMKKLILDFQRFGTTI